MFQTKKWLMILGCFLFAGLLSFSKQDVHAADNYAAGSYITCTADTSLYTAADVNSGVVTSVKAGDLGTVVSYDEDAIYTLVQIGDATGYLYNEFMGQDQTIIDAYLAQQEAERAAQEALAHSAEIQELAAIIQCEAGGESYEGQLAVGAVVMNRVKSAAYPDDIHSVIYQAGQFTPARSGSVASLLASGNIKQSCHDAAMAAYAGTDNTGGLLHFHRANGDNGLVIGNQVFF